MDQVEGVEPDPEDHDPDLREDEDPAPDQAGEIGCDAVREGELALDLAVEVSDRGVVVLVLDEVPGDVFDFSSDRHGSFLWGCCDECRGSVRMHSFAQKTPIWLRKVSLTRLGFIGSRAISGAGGARPGGPRCGWPAPNTRRRCAASLRR